MDIDLAQLDWKDISEDEEKPASRLLARVSFDGVGHHLEAIQVEEQEGVQSSVDVRWNEMLVDYREATGADGAFSTVQIKDQTYVLVMTPYCA